MKSKQRPMGKKCPGPSGNCIWLEEKLKMGMAKNGAGEISWGLINQDWALSCG